MAAHRGFPDPAPGSDRGDALPPIRLPFTVVPEGPAIVAQVTERSWGHRLGLWWTEIDEGEGGVLVTGLLPRGQAEKSGGIRVGDVIVEIGGSRVVGLGDVKRLLDQSSDVARLTVKSGVDGAPRTVAIPLDGTTSQGRASSGISARITTARVPTTTVEESIEHYIECILSSPLQSEVTHEGVAADPAFGCLGADLDFSLQTVPISQIQNAILRSEPRIRIVGVSAVDLEIRRGGEVVTGPGIRVEAKYAASGAQVTIDLEVEAVRRLRRTLRRRAPR